MKSNLDLWNELALIHSTSKYYDFDYVLNGGSTLMQIEKEILGDIRSADILHLHCHLGHDTISYARLANYIVGIDFSPKAIDIAKRFAKECKQNNVDFIVQDVQKLSSKDVNHAKFDLAIATYGVLMWVQDLNLWVNSIASQLKPKGKLIIIDEHPFAAVFSGEKDNGLKLYAPYSCSNQPYITNNDFSYADDKTPLKNNTQYKWGHGISKIFKTFNSASLNIINLEEYHKCFYNMLPNMIKSEDGYWYLKEKQESLPLMFSIIAEKR